jgi:hypothetical protein
VAQGVGPEFKSYYGKKKKVSWGQNSWLSLPHSAEHSGVLLQIMAKWTENCEGTLKAWLNVPNPTDLLQDISLLKESALALSLWLKGRLVLWVPVQET